MNALYNLSTALKQPRPRVPANAWFALSAQLFGFAVLLFGAAGTFFWPAAWAFLLIFFGWKLLITIIIAHHDPALLAERAKPLIQKGQPLWDKMIVAAIVVFAAGWLIVMGLDAMRFHWSAMPIWLQWLGAAGVITAIWIYHVTLRTNTFLANVVKIQNERDHKVISDGPYAIVRHPFYAGALLFLPMAALMLGSWVGLAVTPLIASLYIVRTVLEDRELHQFLDGYADYACRVRYRLIPLVW
jgi:protein-S-isoprenylcysteine O-methyltransferase Ste14